MAASPSLDLRAVVNSLQRLSIGQTEQLAFQLGVELNTLEDINIQYNGSSRKMHYIQAWLNDDPEPSWEKIVTGLRQNGLNVVAAEVESQYCPQSQVPGHNSAQPAVSSPDRIVERRVVLPSVTLGLDDLFDVESELADVKDKWRCIGKALRLHVPTLDEIEANNRTVHDCLSAVLGQWLRKNYNWEKFGEPSWKLLVDAVAHPSGGNDSALAEKITSKYGVSQ